MKKKLKVLNYYKIMFLLISYEDSFDSTKSQSESEKKLVHLLARKPVISRLIRADYFSDIDDVTLDTLKELIERELKRPNLFNHMKSMCEKTVGEWKSLIPPEDIKLLKALGVQKPFSSSTKDSEEVGLVNFFRSEIIFYKMTEHLVEDIETEIKSREREIEKFAPTGIPDKPKGQKKQRATEPVVGKRYSADDSLLVPFRKKLASSETDEPTKSSKAFKSFVERFKDQLFDCKNLDSIEELLLTYTTPKGCDLMNGFLRGDLTTLKSKKLTLKPSWGTDLNVSFNLLLDIVTKSLKLKKELMRGTLDEDTTLYKGLSFDKFMKYTGIPKNVTDGVCEYYGDIDSPLKAVAEYITNYGGGRLCYKSPEMTSTSLDLSTAVSHSKKFSNVGQVVMEICVKKGTAFGKDFSKTSFGPNDPNREVLLMPNQKIKVLGASFDHILHVKCETVL